MKIYILLFYNKKLVLRFSEIEAQTNCAACNSETGFEIDFKAGAKCG
jgi:hypothetical protein